MGNLNRFANRRQVAAYVGLVPSSQESGEADDRKGHCVRPPGPPSAATRRSGRCMSGCLPGTRRRKRSRWSG
ncbi:MAG: transposase [Phycisphaerae bacterium]